MNSDCLNHQTLESLRRANVPPLGEDSIPANPCVDDGLLLVFFGSGHINPNGCCRTAPGSILHRLEDELENAANLFGNILSG